MGNVVVMAVYPTNMAGTRLRAWQYRYELAEHGHQMTLWTFFTASSAEMWLGGRYLGRALAFGRGILRIPGLIPLIRKAEIVIVLRQALPIGPAVLEWWSSRRRKLIWDIDDAIWETVQSTTVGRVPQWIRATGRKYEWICRRADQVWAGNETVGEWCRIRASDVRLVPTVIAVPEGRPDRKRVPVVGWIGSLSTGPFLEMVLPALRTVEPVPKVTVVGARVRVPAGLEVSQEPWTEEAERRALTEMRIGLYPIDRNHALAEGKSGFKAILYMSRGVPVVVTPTRSNSAIVRDGVEGIHAERPDDWRAAVEVLLGDPELWERCSVAAHRRARDEYSLERWAPIVASYVDELAGQ